MGTPEGRGKNPEELKSLNQAQEECGKNVDGSLRQGDVDIATVTDESGVGLQLRRHYSRKDGRWYLNAVMLFGTEILRSAGLKLLVSS